LLEEPSNNPEKGVQCSNFVYEWGFGPKEGLTSSKFLETAGMYDKDFSASGLVKFISAMTHGHSAWGIIMLAHARKVNFYFVLFLFPAGYEFYSQLVFVGVDPGLE
jgi:hypothetical protein